LPNIKYNNAFSLDKKLNRQQQLGSVERDAELSDGPPSQGETTTYVGGWVYPSGAASDVINVVFAPFWSKSSLPARRERSLYVAEIMKENFIIWCTSFYFNPHVTEVVLQFQEEYDWKVSRLYLNKKRVISWGHVRKSH
jgi:hypothetical protein